MLANLEIIEEMNVFSADKRYFRFLEKNRDLINLMNAFFSETRTNPKKNTVFDRQKVVQYLKRVRL